ncbi:MAG: hypothetical protein Q8P52_02210 [bacterium]|nr:hypothetical protein [bacterium]
MKDESQKVGNEEVLKKTLGDAEEAVKDLKKEIEGAQSMRQKLTSSIGDAVNFRSFTRESISTIQSLYLKAKQYQFLAERLEELTQVGKCTRVVKTLKEQLAELVGEATFYVAELERLISPREDGGASSIYAI